MTLAAHHESLSRQHTALEAQIHDEELRPAPNAVRLTELKKQKLALKDKMHQEKKIMDGRA